MLFLRALAPLAVLELPMVFLRRALNPLGTACAVPEEGVSSLYLGLLLTSRPGR
jgi:hypothetical protein